MKSLSCLRAVQAAATLLILLSVPSLRAQGAIADATADLRSAIVTYAGDNSSSHYAALETAFNAFNTTVAANATTTVTIDDNLNPHQNINYTHTVVVEPTAIFLNFNTNPNLTPAELEQVAYSYYYYHLSETGSALILSSEATYSLTSSTASLSDRGAVSKSYFSSSGSSPYSVNGAAINNATGSKTTIIDANFRNNISGDGGAIYNRSGGAVTAVPTITTMVDTWFQFNSAYYDGGAIYNQNVPAEVVIASTRFEDNTSGRNGGAIFNLGGTVTLVDVDFTANSAGVMPPLISANPSLGEHNGGAIANVAGTLVATNASFTNNTALNAGNGGAIFNEQQGTVTVTDSIFTGNHVDLKGGAIYQDTGTLNLRVTAGKTMTFTGNTAGDLANSIHLDNSGTLNVNVASGGLLDLADPMSGNATGVIAITKTGDGIWQLDGANTFTSSGGGSTIFNVTEGTLRLVAGASLSLGGTGSLLTISNTGTLSGTGAVIMTDSSNLTFDLSNAITVDNAISGAGSVTQAGTGTLTLSAANSYTGGTSVNAGTLILQNTTASPSFSIASGAALDLHVASGTRDASAATTTFSGAGTLRKSGAGTVRWGGNSAVFALSAGALIDVQGGTFAGGNFANENWTANLSGLHVAAGATFVGAEANVRVDALTGSGTITSGYTGAGYQNFTFGVANGSGTFTGVLANDGSGHVGNYVKVGTGTQTLSGANTYTGTTSINNGTLIVNGSLANTAVTVSSGATLGGNGTIGDLTLDDGSTLAPGASPGTLFADDTIWNGGGTYLWEINRAVGVAGIDWDLLSITGALTLAATSESPFILSLVSLTTSNAPGLLDGFDAAQNYSYTIATASGGISGFDAGAFTINATGFANDLAGGTWSLALTGNNLNLHFSAASAIPEPGTYAALAGLLALGLALHRKRRR